VKPPPKRIAARERKEHKENFPFCVLCVLSRLKNLVGYA